MGGNWIFQVKYADIEGVGAAVARNALVSTFDKEIAAVLRHSHTMDNYVLITNVSLTGESRDRLHRRAAASGFEGKFAVVDGKEVCQFLDIHPNIRRSYPQLLGLVDLDQIVHRDLHNRSKAYVELWQPKLATYVLTEGHEKAVDVLARRRFVVLDGPPEVGKTTIAAALALIHAAEGFEVVDTRGPNDFFSAYNREQAQLFVADDAIGSVSFDPGLADNWARDLPSILAKLDAKHVLIWTARRYILEEAVAESKLAESAPHFPGSHEVVVEVGQLTPLQKAEILYNHAKRSTMGPHARKTIRDNALNIVQHKGFTPERARQLAEVVLAPATQDEASKTLSTWADLDSFLSNPGDRWVKAYRAISSSERDLLASMLDFDFRVDVQELSTAYTLRASADAEPRLNFEQCLNRLRHSFLSSSKDYQGHEYVNFQHPSLRDLLLSELNQTGAARKRYIELASPSGLAAVIRGLARFADNDEPGHAVFPRSEEELSALCSRVAQLASIPLPSEDWERILAATDLLLPRMSSKKTAILASKPLTEQLAAVLESRRQKVAPSDLKLGEFEATMAGRIVKQVLLGFGSSGVYENNRRYEVGEWVGLLRRFYELSAYVVPPPRLELSRYLLSDLDPNNPVAGIRLSNIIVEFEPVLIRQTIGAKSQKAWDEHLRLSLEELVYAGEGLEDSEYSEDEYDEWKSQSNAVCADAEAFYSWSESSQPDSLDHLWRLLERISPPPEPDYEQRIERNAKSSEFWTIPRIFEDL